MESARFKPIPTCEIPPPVVEHRGGVPGDAGILPRVLLQSAGRASHSRRHLLMAVAFALLAVLEALLLLRLAPKPLVVYQEPTVRALLEDIP